MSFINYASKEIIFKIVYFGPGMGGKTTSVRYIYNQTVDEAKEQIISLTMDSERTLFFDFLPLLYGDIKGFKTRFHVYTIPGQQFYDASKRVIMKGVDGIIFVADSQINRMQENVEAFEMLEKVLYDLGIHPAEIPMVIQYNKRDVEGAASLDDMRKILNSRNVKDFEAIATKGIGVFEPLKELSKEILGSAMG